MSLLLIIGLAGCEKEEGRKITDYKEYTITVASEKVTGLIFSSGNNYVSDVYAILKEHSAEWEQLAYMEGFEYEAGYEYTLRISETSYLDHSMGEPGRNTILLKRYQKRKRHRKVFLTISFRTGSTANIALLSIRNSNTI